MARPGTSDAWKASAFEQGGRESKHDVDNASTPGPALHIFDPTMMPHARVVLRIIRGDEVTDEARLALPATPIDWAGLAGQARKGKTPEARQKSVERYLHILAATSEEDAATIRWALKEAESGPDESAAAADLGFDLKLIDTATFFEETYDLCYLIARVLVAVEACVFAGPSKSLKTSILLDMAISLASATPFLGKYHVPEAVRVGFISGESGKRIIQRNAKKICDERGLPYSAVATIFWGFILPTLTEREHLEVLRQTIVDHQLKVVILDPLYLMLVSGAAGVDVKDMQQVGQLLKKVCDICIEAGATPIICHHFVKNREEKFQVPELVETAGAGVAQVFRQWVLVGPRQAYDPATGLHRIHLCFGGSAGHSGQVEVDILTGCLDDEGAGNRWHVLVLEQQIFGNPGEQRKAEGVRKALEKEDVRDAERQAIDRKLMGKFLDVLRDSPGGVASNYSVRTATGWRTDKLDRIARLCIESGAVRTTQLARQNKKGEPLDPIDGFKLTNPPGEQNGTFDFNPVR